MFVLFVAGYQPVIAIPHDESVRTSTRWRCPTLREPCRVPRPLGPLAMGQVQRKRHGADQEGEAGHEHGETSDGCRLNPTGRCITEIERHTISAFSYRLAREVPSKGCSATWLARGRAGHWPGPTGSQRLRLADLSFRCGCLVGCIDDEPLMPSSSAPAAPRRDRSKIRWSRSR